MATLEAIEGDVTLGRFQARTFASRRVLGPVVSVLLLGLLVQSCASTTPGPSTTIRQYLAAWSRGDYRSMRTMVLDPPATFVSFNKNVASTLGLLRASFAS